MKLLAKFGISIIAFPLVFASALGAAPKDVPVTDYPEWSLQVIQFQDGEGPLKKGFLITPPDDRQPHVISQETGALLQKGSIEPEEAYLRSYSAKKVSGGDEKKSSPAPEGTAPENPPPSAHEKAKTEEAAPTKHPKTESKKDESETNEIPNAEGWSLRPLDSGKGDKLFSLKPPDDRPAGIILGVIASRLTSGGLDAETAYRTAQFAQKSKGEAGGSVQGSSSDNVGGAQKLTGTKPDTSKNAKSTLSNSAKNDSSSDGKSSSSSSSTATETSTKTAKKEDGATIGITPFKGKEKSRCQPRAAKTGPTTTSKVVVTPPPPLTNKTLQGISDLWKDKSGAHRGTVTPEANCPKGYSAHPYYADKSNLSGIIADVGFEGYMGGGTFFCTISNPDADKVITDVKITEAKAVADPCPQGYESTTPFASCPQGAGAACAVKALQQNLCIKKEKISEAKVALVDFGITPTLSQGLGHLSDIPCPDGYTTLGNTTSCGGAAAYCSGKQFFCMKTKEVSSVEGQQGTTSTITSVSTGTLESEVICLEGNDEDSVNSPSVPGGKSDNPESDITGTKKKKPGL